MSDNNFIGNTSTIIKWLSMMLAGAVIGTLAAHGLNLNVDQTTLSEVIAAFLFLVLGYIDARFPNTFGFLNNNKPQVGSTETENDIPEIDPASEYGEDDIA